MKDTVIRRLFSGPANKEMKDRLKNDGLSNEDIFQLEKNVFECANMTAGDDSFDLSLIKDFDFSLKNKIYYKIFMLVYIFNNFFDYEVYGTEIEVRDDNYYYGDIEKDDDGIFRFHPMLDNLYEELFETEIDGHNFTIDELEIKYEETDPKLIRLRKVLDIIFNHPDSVDDCLDSVALLYAKRIYRELKTTNFIRFELPDIKF